MRIHGVSFSVNWRNFEIGSSFFLPCLDADDAIEKIKKTVKRLGFVIQTQIVVEKGIKGVRVWRLL